MDLDDVVPRPDHVTTQSRLIAAPPAVVWEELHRITLSSLPLSALLIGIRFLPALLLRPGRALPLDRNFVDVVPLPVLSSEAPTALVYGGLLHPWRLTDAEQGPRVDAVELRSWDEAGWVKAAMEFRLAPADDGTLLRTETRVAATDRASALMFAGYWLVVRPGSSTIRHEVLAAVALRAEARVTD